MHIIHIKDISHTYVSKNAATGNRLWRVIMLRHIMWWTSRSKNDRNKIWSERQSGKKREKMTERETHTCRSVLWPTDSGLVVVLALAGLDTGEPRPGSPFGSSSSWGTEDPMASTPAKVWGDTYTKNAHTGLMPRKRVILREQQKEHSDVSDFICVTCTEITWLLYWLTFRLWFS